MKKSQLRQKIRQIIKEQKIKTDRPCDPVTGYGCGTVGTPSIGKPPVPNTSPIGSGPQYTEKEIEKIIQNSNLPDDMKPILVGLGDSILYLLGLKTPPPADDPVVDTPL